MSPSHDLGLAAKLCTVEGKMLKRMRTRVDSTTDTLRSKSTQKASIKRWLPPSKRVARLASQGLLERARRLGHQALPRTSTTATKTAESTAASPRSECFSPPAISRSALPSLQRILVKQEAKSVGNSSKFQTVPRPVELTPAALVEAYAQKWQEGKAPREMLRMAAESYVEHWRESTEEWSMTDIVKDFKVNWLKGDPMARDDRLQGAGGAIGNDENINNASIRLIPAAAAAVGSSSEAPAAAPPVEIFDSAKSRETAPGNGREQRGPWGHEGWAQGAENQASVRDSEVYLLKKLASRLDEKKIQPGQYQAVEVEILSINGACNGCKARTASFMRSLAELVGVRCRLRYLYRIKGKGRGETTDYGWLADQLSAQDFDQIGRQLWLHVETFDPPAPAPAALAAAAVAPVAGAARPGAGNTPRQVSSAPPQAPQQPPRQTTTSSPNAAAAAQSGKKSGEDDGWQVAGGKRRGKRR